MAIGEQCMLHMQSRAHCPCNRVTSQDVIDAIPAIEDAAVAKLLRASAAEDVVKHPSHYQLLEGIEVIDIIASSLTVEQYKGYCLGNIMKYRLRAGKKDDLQQEIDKADQYVTLFEKNKHLCMQA